MKKFIVLVVLVICFMATGVSAKCFCMCINNEKTMVCENTWDTPYGYCEGWCSGY